MNLPLCNTTPFPLFFLSNASKLLTWAVCCSDFSRKAAPGCRMGRQRRFESQQMAWTGTVPAQGTTCCVKAIACCFCYQAGNMRHLRFIILSLRPLCGFAFSHWTTAVLFSRAWKIQRQEEPRNKFKRGETGVGKTASALALFPVVSAQGLAFLHLPQGSQWCGRKGCLFFSTNTGGQRCWAFIWPTCPPAWHNALWQAITEKSLVSRWNSWKTSNKETWNKKSL